MDAITLLKQDHETIKTLFRRFEDAGPRAHKRKRELVDRMILELSKHAAIEEQVFYPAVRETIAEQEDTVLEALEEHHVAKITLTELEGMDPEHERFDAKVTVLIEMTKHHIEEEETEMFPAVRKAIGRKRLDEIGEAMAAAKKLAPPRPHPRMPDTPPLNIVGGVAASLVDPAARALKGAKRRVTG